jgi:hypothetical protein
MDGVRLPDAWHDLYLMLGTSSAALIGLLFVAASLHLREIANDDVYRLRVQYTTLILVSTLLMATAILTPQPLRWLGVELLLVNVWGLSFPLTLLWRAVKGPSTRGRGRASAGQMVYFFLAGYLIGAAGSFAVTADKEWGMAVVTLCYAICLVASIWNAWTFLLGIGRNEQKRQH